MKTFPGSLWRRPEEPKPVQQDLQVLIETERFRRYAVAAWDKKTIYPKNEYIVGKSNGQCGVTNYGFGLWLAHLGIVQPDKMFFEEGKIVTADGSLVGGNHNWLFIEDIDDGYSHPDLEMRFDLAGDQFPGIEYPEVVQYADYFYPGPDTPYGNCVYEADRVTRFSEFDIERFAGRLGVFMGNIEMITGVEIPIPG